MLGEQYVGAASINFDTVGEETTRNTDDERPPIHH